VAGIWATVSRLKQAPPAAARRVLNKPPGSVNAVNLGGAQHLSVLVVHTNRRATRPVDAKSHTVPDHETSARAESSFYARHISLPCEGDAEDR